MRVGQFLDANVVLECFRMRRIAQRVGKDRDQQKPPDARDHRGLDRELQAAAVDGVGHLGSGAAGARREDHGIGACHHRRQTLNRQARQVARDRRSAELCKVCGLLLLAVKRQRLMSAFSQLLDEAPADLARSPNDENLRHG